MQEYQHKKHKIRIMGYLGSCVIFLMLVLQNMLCLCNEGIILCYLYTPRENIVCTSVINLVL